jgi:hypothetical protein
MHIIDSQTSHASAEMRHRPSTEILVRYTSTCRMANKPSHRQLNMLPVSLFFSDCSFCKRYLQLPL